MSEPVNHNQVKQNWCHQTLTSHKEKLTKNQKKSPNTSKSSPLGKTAKNGTQMTEAFKLGATSQSSLTIQHEEKVRPDKNLKKPRLLKTENNACSPSDPKKRSTFGIV